MLRPFNIRSLTLFYTKLYKVGYISDDKCSFCKSEPETLLHLFLTAYTQSFSGKILNFTFTLCHKNLFILQDILIGIITSECPLLNYFLLIAKLYIWDCRRSQILPSLAGFKIKIKTKFETEKYICTKNKTLDQFRKLKMGDNLSCVNNNFSFYCITLFVTLYCPCNCILT